MKTIFLILMIPLFLISFENSFATNEPIPITISPSMEDVIFDGKWTHKLEWKQSSHNMISYENSESVIHLRTAHFGDYIYVFIDSINDFTLDEKMDKAIICFDAKNNKSFSSDSDDFCFSVTLNSNQGNILQGASSSDENINFKKIDNPENFIAVSTISDENDRYSLTPHPSYEFKIPIQILNRSDNYGFYLSVYDATSNEYSTWPENSTMKNSQIPSPSEWGNIISPDKSLPELNLPIVVFAILIFGVILAQSKLKMGILRSF